VEDRIDTQRLPIPVGAKHAQRRIGRIFRLRSLNFNRYALLAAIGLVGAIGGAFIASQPPSIAVSLTPKGDLQIQSFTLRHSTDASGNDVYQSEYGAMLLTHSAAGIVTGGSTTLNGQDMTGRCTYNEGASTAACSFLIGSRHLTATDTRASSGWDRTYSDGKQVKIAWPNPAFPLPFALGE